MGWSVLLMEETGVSEENCWPPASPWQTLSDKVVPGWKKDGQYHFGVCINVGRVKRYLLL